MTRTSVALAAAALLTLAGCQEQDVNPFAKRTDLALGRQDIRVTQGPGSGPIYRPAVRVRPGSVVQVRTVLGAGEEVRFTATRGPARTIRFTAKTRGVTRQTVAHAAGSRPLRTTDLFEFDPGVTGVEHDSTSSTLQLLVTTPRLPGASEKQILTFTFKARIE